MNRLGANEKKSQSDLGALAYGIADELLAATNRHPTASVPVSAVEASSTDDGFHASTFANAVVLTAQAIAMAGDELLVNDQTELRVCVPMGAFGVEVLALTHVLPHLAPAVRKLDVTLLTSLGGTQRIRSGIMDHADRLWRSAGGERSLLWRAIAAGPDLVGAAAEADVVVLRERADSTSDAHRYLQPAPERPATQRILLISEAGQTADGREDAAALSGATALLQAATIDIPAPEPAVTDRDRLPGRRTDPGETRRLWARTLLLGRPAAAPSRVAPNEDQRGALAAFEAFLSSKDRVFLLRGPAGTGKTFLFRSLVSAAQRRELGSALMAPTGAAAQRLHDRVGRPGATVHSTIYTFDRVRQIELGTQQSLADELGLEGEQDSASDVLPVAVFRRGEPPIEPLLYIVDEASLVGDAERDPNEPTEVEFGEGRVLSDLLWFALRAERSRLVLAGDHRQLAPVDDPDAPALDPSTYETLDIGVATYDLTENVRHRTAPTLGRIAQRLMEELDAGATRRDVDMLLGDEAGDGVRRHTGDPYEVDGLLEQVASVRATIVTHRNVDVARWNRITRERLGRPGDRPAAGDRLLVVKTVHDRGIYNGTEVEVIEVADEPEVVEIRRESVRLWPARLRVQLSQGLDVQVALLLVGDTLERAHRDDLLRVTRVLTADFFRRTGLKRKDPKLTATAARDDRLNALRAQYAYARTCYRAQGGEWDRVVVDRSRLPSAELRWFYTAITRAREEAIVLDPTEADRSIDVADAVEELTERLAAIGIAVASHREVQDGLQLTVRPLASAASDSTSRLNLYWQSGRPSKVVLTGKDTAGLGAEAKACISDWIEQAVAAASPVSSDVAETVARLTAACAQAGILLECQGRGPYLVAMVARRGDTTCRTEWHHNSRGRFTKPARDRDAGDAELLSELTTIIRDAG